MPTLRPGAYAESLKTSIRNQDGKTLASFLQIHDSHSRDILNSLGPGDELTNPNPPFMTQFKLKLFKPWDQIASSHVRTLMLMDYKTVESPNVGKMDMAFKEQSTLTSTLFRFLRESTTAARWALPALYIACKDLRMLALEADRQCHHQQEKRNQERSGKVVTKYDELITTGVFKEPLQWSKTEELSRSLRTWFGQSLNDRSGAGILGLKRSIYPLSILLFKIYFQLSNTVLSKDLGNHIKNQPDVPDFELYPKSDKVAYRYYTGLLAFRNEEWREAENNLSYAFEHCHRKAVRNRELILTLLIPLRLLRNSIPSSSLLKSFSRLGHLYRPFIAAYRQGNVAAYDRALKWAEARLLESGTYMVVERAREGVVRRLIKRIWLIEDKSSRIPLSLVYDAFVHPAIGNLSECDMDEVECILSGFIYKGHIKGYLSHTHQMLVLSRQDPFPSISSGNSSL